MQRPTVLISVSSAIVLFVILRHRTNISRLLAGTESKMGQKAASPKS
jgi:glycerol-3-phosphate acyltransferase PlsY